MCTRFNGAFYELIVVLFLSLSLSLSLIHRSLIVLLWSSLLFCMFVRFWESRAQACHVFFHGRLMHANYKEQRVVDMSSIVAFCDWFFEAAMLLTYNSHKVIRPLTIVWAYMQLYAHYAQYTACFAGCEKPARRYHHPSQAKIRPDWAFPYVAGGWLANRHLVTGGSLSGRNSVTKWDELVSLTQLDSAWLCDHFFPQLVGTPHHLSIFDKLWVWLHLDPDLLLKQWFSKIWTSLNVIFECIRTVLTHLIQESKSPRVQEHERMESEDKKGDAA